MPRREAIIARWDGSSLKALHPSDRARMQSFEPGTLLMMFPYNGKKEEALRFLHMLLHAAEENSPTPTTMEGLKQRLKLAGGWFSGARMDPDGTVHAKLRSLGDFDADELSTFIEQAIDLIETEVLPGVDHKQLMSEVSSRTKRRQP